GSSKVVASMANSPAVPSASSAAPRVRTSIPIPPSWLRVLHPATPGPPAFPAHSEPIGRATTTHAYGLRPPFGGIRRQEPIGAGIVASAPVGHGRIACVTKSGAEAPASGESRGLRETEVVSTDNDRTPPVT